MIGDRYLARLRCARTRPSVSELHRLHRAHVELVPYETTWLHLGERRGVDPATSVGLIADGQRGGYCFHLNGALAWLLDDLGYSVTMHRGAVHGDGPDRADMANHLVLLVDGLPTADNPQGVWYVDAGLGDALHEPLPLLAGDYHQGPVGFTLEETGDGIGDWRLTADALVGVGSMSFERTPTTIDSFAESHRRLSTAPDSPFVRVVTAQRRVADGSVVLRGKVLSIRRGDGIRRHVISDRDQWFATLATRFHLPLHHLDPGALDRLWRHVDALAVPDLP